MALRSGDYKDMKTEDVTAAVSLVVYDFDGVMTDNRVLVNEDGSEAVVCNRSDGLGIGLIRDLGIKQLILSTETNPVVTARAKKLDLPVIQSCVDKRAELLEFCEKNGYLPEQVLYVGNDRNDLEVMNLVGYPVAPADAHQCILDIAVMVTKAKGGEGVIKEIAENLGVILQRTGN